MIIIFQFPGCWSLHISSCPGYWSSHIFQLSRLLEFKYFQLSRLLEFTYFQLSRLLEFTYFQFSRLLQFTYLLEGLEFNYGGTGSINLHSLHRVYIFTAPPVNILYIVSTFQSRNNRKITMLYFCTFCQNNNNMFPQFNTPPQLNYYKIPPPQRT